MGLVRDPLLFKKYHRDVMYSSGNLFNRETPLSVYASGPFFVNTSPHIIIQATDPLKLEHQLANRIEGRREHKVCDDQFVSILFLF